MKVKTFLQKYIGKPISDLFNTSEFERAVNNIVSNETKHIFTFAVPGNGDTVSVTTSANKNIINFTGDITDDFTIDITAWVGATPGDTLYICLNSDSSTHDIHLQGDIINATCGNNDVPDTYDLDSDTRIVLLFIFDGGKYTGTDNC